jgi:glucose-6-phosphate 1-dehydrogenase
VDLAAVKMDFHYDD